MKRHLSILPVCVWIAAVVWLAGCTPKPEPIAYGSDACHSCKMTLADKRFGGELVTNKGKVFVFDDINCMLSYYHSSELDPADLAFTLVVDYEHPAEFLEAGQTFFVKSDQLRSPMNSQVAAFHSYQDAMQFKREKGGILLGWAEVTTQFK
jgi:copper chaperone NosL